MKRLLPGAVFGGVLMLGGAVVGQAPQNWAQWRGVRPKSGKPHYQLQRIEGVPHVFSSAVGADGRVCVTGQDGSTAVLKQGPTYEVLATNKLDDKFDASAALAGSELFLRGYRYLRSRAITIADRHPHQQSLSVFIVVR